jgi:hypothetical protein
VHPELISDRKSINFTDKKGIGGLKPKETRDLHFYSSSTLVGEILLLLAGWLNQESPRVHAP